MTRSFSPDEIAALIAKLEAATGADRELDARIFQIIGAPLPSDFMGKSVDLLWSDIDGCFTMNIGAMRVRYEQPSYTASIDAAMTLVPEGLFWIAGHGKVREPEPMGAAQIISPTDFDSPFGEGEAATVALALCIAALKARASIRESGTRPTGKPGATRPPAPEASGPVGRDSIEGGLS